jgi:hypothetical protein
VANKKLGPMKTHDYQCNNWCHCACEG